jgi:predicted kinase
MDEPTLVILTGPPGAGKSTVARSVADRLGRSACIESDWFWTTVVHDLIPQWTPEADTQNRTVIRSFVAAATRMVGGGYTTVLDGIVGPWHLDGVRDELRAAGVSAHYIVLRPDLDTCLHRATDRAGEERVPGHPPLTEHGPIRLMWERFTDLGGFEAHVIDTTHLSVGTTAHVVVERLDSGAALLPLD